MQEDFLHYIWRLQQFAHRELRTTEGETIEILDTGTHNHHDGPDFSLARIRIGEQLWVGNVEIHVQASEWRAHGHQHDVAYENVILHVVYTEDEPIYRDMGHRLPCLELRQRIAPNLLAAYRKLRHNEYWIACQHHFYLTSEMTRTLWLDRLLVERLQRRTEVLTEALAATQSDWEETYYRLLCRALGGSVNGDAFAQLAERTPLRILLRHKHSLLQLEALLFGQAGLLTEARKDDYPQLLQREYRLLRQKYGLAPLTVSQWRFMRLRPANFPTVRIAQLATLLFRTGQLFSKTLAAQNSAELMNMFAVELSNYWRDHYVFDKATTVRSKRLGKATVQLLLINHVAPFLFFYGRHRNEAALQDQALALLEDMPPERNAVITEWEKLGLQPTSAYQTQALLELKKQYCTPKRCTSCALGHTILQQLSTLRAEKEIRPRTGVS